jgi:hypothetical protein
VCLALEIGTGIIGSGGGTFWSEWKMSNLGIDYTRSQALNYTSYNYETSKTMPDSYGTISGNFDGAGNSFGIIQWNWKSGTLQPIMKDMINLHNADVQAAFTATADYNTFVDVVMNRTTADQIAWGNSISDPANLHKVVEPWNTYFVNLGSFKSCQDRQMSGCTPYFNTADGWASDFGLWTRRGYALCFDTAVQAGGMTTACHTDIMNFVASVQNKYTPEYRELLIMRYFAVRRSADVTSSYQASFRDRKTAIANGSGNVYGYPVSTDPYNLNLEPNGLLAVPAGKIPRWLRITRVRGK